MDNNKISVLKLVFFCSAEGWGEAERRDSLWLKLILMTLLYSNQILQFYLKQIRQEKLSSDFIQVRLDNSLSSLSSMMCLYSNFLLMFALKRQMCFCQWRCMHETFPKHSFHFPPYYSVNRSTTNMQICVSDILENGLWHYLQDKLLK